MEILNELISLLQESPVYEILVGAFITYVESFRIGIPLPVKTCHSSPKEGGRFMEKTSKDIARLALGEGKRLGIIVYFPFIEGIKDKFKEIFVFGLNLTDMTLINHTFTRGDYV